MQIPADIDGRQRRRAPTGRASTGLDREEADINVVKGGVRGCKDTCGKQKSEETRVDLNWSAGL
jgi:hypothetical protein